MDLSSLSPVIAQDLIVKRKISAEASSARCCLDVVYVLLTA